MRLFILFLMLASATGAYAQSNSLYMTSQRQPVRLSIEGLYQHYRDDSIRISQTSSPVTAFFPLRRDLGMTLLVSPATASGRGLETLSGLNDAQVAVSYYREVGSSSVVFSLGSNLPSGRKELTDEEFQTLRILSEHAYGFRVPSVGQGFNLFPGITWAFPLNEGLVLGFGTAYQYRGRFRPLSRRGDYNPGNEILLTGGVDYRLNRVTTLSGDLTYTLYTEDEFEAEVYRSGNKVAVTLQSRSRFGFDELWLLARYRSKAKSSIPNGGFGTEVTKTVPNQAEIAGVYRKRLSNSVYVGGVVRGRFFEAIDSEGERAVLEVGVRPELIVAREASFLGQFSYAAGSFSGIAAGVGMRVQL